MTDRCKRFSILLTVVLTAALGLGAGAAYGQDVDSPRSWFSQRSTYLSWHLTGDTTDFTIRQLYTPVVVQSGFANDWKLSVYSAVATTSADQSYRNGNIRGLDDSRVQVAHSLLGDRVLVSGGLSLPTGQTRLSAASRRLIPWLTADFFTFPLKYPGEGLDFFGELATAMPLGEWVVGTAGAIHYSGEFTPYDDNRSYQPGARLVGTVRAQRDWAKRGHISTDLIVVYSTDDKAEGTPVFSDGIEFDLRVTGRRQYEHGWIEAAARVILRGKNKIITGESLDLVREAGNTNGNDYRFYFSGTRQLIRNLQGWLSMETKLLAANQYNPGDPLYEDFASVTGIGGGLDMHLGQGASAGIGVRLWTGRTDGSATFEALDLSAVEIMQRLTVTF